jgi:hypothetical protein
MVRKSAHPLVLRSLCPAFGLKGFSLGLDTATTTGTTADAATGTTATALLLQQHFLISRQS